MLGFQPLCILHQEAAQMWSISPDACLTYFHVWLVTESPPYFPSFCPPPELDAISCLRGKSHPLSLKAFCLYFLTLASHWSCLLKTSKDQVRIKGLVAMVIQDFFFFFFFPICELCLCTLWCRWVSVWNLCNNCACFQPTLAHRLSSEEIYGEVITYC